MAHVAAQPIITSSTVASPAMYQPPAFSLDDLQFRYEPFPIGYCADVLDRNLYQSLLKAWPSHDLFEYKPGLGDKYSLSEVNHAGQYQEFIRTSAPWNALHKLIKSRAFIEYVLEMLKDQNIDVGYPAEALSSRFEFSMLSGAGGNIKPHTDAMNKIITLVIFMVAPGEWQDSYGGGTAILKPKDVRRNYNHMNIQLEFDQCENLGEFPFDPNGCVLFIKTFNSYHAVYPTRAPKGVLRRSLTINIEDLHDPRLKYCKGTRPKFRL